MATSSGTKINALTVEKYEVTKKCDICCKEQPVGFEFLVVTCGCGCGEKKDHVKIVLLVPSLHVLV